MSVQPERLGGIDMHPDFGHLSVRPGHLDIHEQPELYHMTNLLALGGRAGLASHTPEIAAELDDIVFWQSTGAPDALPFWNTNFLSDVFLLLLEGDVRFEFKVPETEHLTGSLEAHTGDLFRLPRDVAHRSFSTSGKRRISLEIMHRNPFWDRQQPPPYESIPGARPARQHRHGLGQFTFERDAETIVAHTPNDTVTTPRGPFLRGLRTLNAFALHLHHNEFEGGFVVHDFGDHVLLKTRQYFEAHSTLAVVGLFEDLLRDWSD
jgi:hypothetical protein